jgi:hypothetical protein
MTLTPAYGCDYKSGKDVKAAFAEGKDFVIADVFGGNAGRMTNREDLVKAGVRSVNIRFKRMMNVVVVKVA